MHKPVCSHCKSDDVKADAYATWDYFTQAWEVSAIMDGGAVCEVCDGETRLARVEVPE